MMGQWATAIPSDMSRLSTRDVSFSTPSAAHQPVSFHPSRPPSTLYPSPSSIHNFLQAQLTKNISFSDFLKLLSNSISSISSIITSNRHCYLSFSLAADVLDLHSSPWARNTQFLREFRGWPNHAHSKDPQTGRPMTEKAALVMPCDCCDVVGSHLLVLVCSCPLNGGANSLRP